MIRAILIILGTIAIIAVITAFVTRFFGTEKMIEMIDLVLRNQVNKETIATNMPPTLTKESEPVDAKENTTLNIPLNNPIVRITKKPFGIEVDPKNSPVQPEKFSGFHTGTDFEIFDNEFNADIKVKSICDGDIIQKTSVNGYGGVIIQECQYRDEPVLILYGHINPATFTKETQIKKEDEIASLSPDNSPQSGYERKHLHLGVIKGKKINYRGYVQLKNELENWIDAINLIE